MGWTQDRNFSSLDETDLSIVEKMDRIMMLYKVEAPPILEGLLIRIKIRRIILTTALSSSLDPECKSY